MKKLTLLVLLLVATFTFTSQAVELSMLSNDPRVDGYNGEAMQAFKFYVESQSNGEIKVTLHHGSNLCGGGRECFEALNMDVVDCYQSNIGEVANFWAPFAVFDLPYMLKNDRIAEMVFDQQDFIAQLRAGIMSKVPNARLMVISNSGGWRNFATTKKLIKSPKDIEGMKIRTIPADVQKRLVTAMGGAPTGIVWGELYTALATGIVEGTKNGITDIKAINLDDSIKYITLDGHAYAAGTWFMSQSKFESLSDEHKKIVIDGFDIIKSYLRTYPRFNEVPAYEAFVEKGGTIYTPTPEEKLEFKAAAAPVIGWFVNLSPENKALFTKYQEIIARAEKVINEEYALEMK